MLMNVARYEPEGAASCTSTQGREWVIVDHHRLSVISNSYRQATAYECVTVFMLLTCRLNTIQGTHHFRRQNPEHSDAKNDHGKCLRCQ